MLLRSLRLVHCREGVWEGVMEQQQANSAPSPPTSSASTGSLGGNSASGGAVLASTADSIGVTAETNNVTALPHRRRLGKTTTRPLAETKRDGPGGPPGFGTSAIPSPSLASPGTPGASPGAPGSFRERVALRSSGKADLAADQHGVGGSSKPGRSPHSNTGAPEPRHLGRRPEVNLRRHEAGQAQKYADGQQAKRAALLRAQTSGSAGNFKTFDSSHNNYLVPVIPLQFAAKQ